MQRCIVFRHYKAVMAINMGKTLAIYSTVSWKTAKTYIRDFIQIHPEGRNEQLEGKTSIPKKSTINSLIMMNSTMALHT